MQKRQQQQLGSNDVEAAVESAWRDCRNRVPGETGSEEAIGMWRRWAASERYLKAHNRCIAWMAAEDVPLLHDDRALAPERLHDKRCRWLERHGQQTAHFSSVLPLVVSLPVRLTDCVDRERKLFRGRRGKVVGWAPHPAECRQEVDGEWLLSRMPVASCVHFPGVEWTVYEDLGKGVYPLTPISRTWKVSKRTDIQARRTGYFLLPDFAFTTHMVQGADLDAVFPDALAASAVTTVEHHIAGHVGLSRAKRADAVWVLRPFSPWLFQRGPPERPETVDAEVALRYLGGTSW